MLEMAPSMYEGCDDSNGAIGNVIAAARDDLRAIVVCAGQSVGTLADRVFAAVCKNDFGQFDNLISLMAHALGADGLHRIKVRLEESAANVPKGAGGERRVIGFSMRGPIYEDDYERDRHRRLVRSALTEIADALGDGWRIDANERLTYGYDNSRRQAMPDAVALPATREQVVALVCACRAHRVPVIARGRGTNTTGAAVPIAGGWHRSTVTPPLPECRSLPSMPLSMPPPTSARSMMSSPASPRKPPLPKPGHGCLPMPNAI
jgi:hypothetical protein